MTALLVDAGNSSIKWCLLKDGNLSKQQRCTYQSQNNDKQKSPQECFERIIDSNETIIERVFIVSVLGDGFIKAAQTLCTTLKLKFINISADKVLAGVKNAYDEPQKLGADRLIAMVAVQHQHNSADNKQASIIIDSGTATTIDAIDKNGQHLGGLILPGLNLCTNSLISNTKQLPLWGQELGKERDQEFGETLNKNQKNFKPELFSKNTTQAIQSASVLGLAGAIDSICSSMENSINKNTTVNKILSGGGAKILQPYLQSTYTLNET